jgi:hypothetical protein
MTAVGLLCSRLTDNLRRTSSLLWLARTAGPHWRHFFW